MLWRLNLVLTMAVGPLMTGCPSLNRYVPPEMRVTADHGPITGIYEGSSGGARFLLEIHPQGKAVIRFEDNPPIDTQYVENTKAVPGERLIIVRLANAGLIFAQTETGLEMRAAENPRQPVRDRRGSTAEATYRRIGDVHAVPKSKPVLATQPKPKAWSPPEWKVRWDTSSDRHDLDHQVGDEGPPRCPKGTEREMKAARLAGISVRPQKSAANS